MASLNGTLVDELPLLTIAASPVVEDELRAADSISFDVYDLLRHDVDDIAILEPGVVIRSKR